MNFAGGGLVPAPAKELRAIPGVVGKTAA